MGKGSPDTSAATAATNQSIGLQKKMYEEGKELAQPWYQAGANSVNALAQLMGLPSSYGPESNPGSTQKLGTGSGSLFFDPRGNLVDASKLSDIPTGYYNNDLWPGLSMGDQVQVKTLARDGNYDGLTKYGYTPYGGASSSFESIDSLPMEGVPGADFGSLTKGFSLEDFEADPGYQFRLDQGNQAIERALAAQGKTLTPEALKAMGEYNQGMASQEYGNAYNRYNIDNTNLFNRLASLSGMGQTASGQMMGVGQNYGNNFSNLQTGLANTQMAADQAGMANNSSMFGTLAGLAMAPMTGGGSLIGSLFSDENLKEDIKKVDEIDGINIYEFDYRDIPGRFRGVIAQEIQKVIPKAVKRVNGYLAVNYDMLPIKMERIA